MLMRLSLIIFFAFASAAIAKEPPYSETANASVDIQQALSSAVTHKKKVLVIFGANWCKDCRALDAALKTEDNAALMSSEFLVVKVDVGNFDKNLDISNQYENPIKGGIPAVVILSSANQILYSSRAGELANARRMSKNGVYEFFKNAAMLGGKNKSTE
jgi:thioredoxin 1